MKISEIKVLICDDSILVRKKLSETLREMGITEIKEATNGNQAVELYKENNPDVVFMDIVMPEKSGLEFTDDFTAKWDTIINAREEANKVLEIKRNEKLIGKSLEANVIVHCKDDDSFRRFSEITDELKTALIVSGISVVKDTDAADNTVSFEVVKAEGEKCERCWGYSVTVGSDCEHPTLCSRCASVVR